MFIFFLCRTVSSQITFANWSRYGVQLLLVLVPGGNRQVQLFSFFLKKKVDRGATVVQHLELSRIQYLKYTIHTKQCLLFLNYRTRFDINLFGGYWFIWLLRFWTWLSNPLMIRQISESQYQWFDYQVIWHYHLIICNSLITVKTISKRLLTDQTNQTQVTESSHMTTTFSVPCLLPTSYPP